MTREEAIKILMDGELNPCVAEDREACDMAIKALEQEPCEDAISRQAAIVALDNRMLSLDNVDMQIAMGFAKGIINDLPLVTPQPKMGEWIPLEYDGYADGNPVWDKWECSKCGWEHSGDEESLTAFCPNCGAKMAESEE